MIGNIADVIRRLVALDPSVALETYRLFMVLLKSKDQAKLKAAIPELERLEDQAHAAAQRD